MILFIQKIIDVIKDQSLNFRIKEVLNFAEYKPIWAHLIALYMNDDSVIHSDDFGVEYISRELIGIKSIKTSI